MGTIDKTDQTCTSESGTRESLDAIGIRHGTDKSSRHHDYLNFYEGFLKSNRDQEVSVLEIGVLNGASLRMWRDYFKHANIVGVDLIPKERSLASERVTLEIADQSNIEQITKIAVKHGPFDLVIEDGSHMWEHQITTFKTVFPFVKQGGLYITEDLQTNYGALTPQFKGISSINFVDYIKSMVDATVADSLELLERIEDPFIRTYAKEIGQITFFRKGCLFVKRAVASSVNGRHEAKLVPAASDLSVVLVAHIGNLGDVVARSGAVSCAEEGAYIQGFSISSDPADSITVSYRARLHDGSWTEWADEGKFVGTRGLAMPVTGIGVKVTSASGRQYDTQCFGAFVDDAGVRSATDGSDCISEGYCRPLRAFQINIIGK